MVTIFVIIFAIGLILSAFISLSFFISSIWENEKRAAIFGGLQSLGIIFLIIIFFYLNSFAFFDTGFGIVILILLILFEIVLMYLFYRKTLPNIKVLAGTKGSIAGQVNRFDERDHVFSRNRSLPADSDQYAAYYKKHPEIEGLDAKRRSKGGPIGRPGFIDSPDADANVAAMLASLTLPQFLSTPDNYSPGPHFFVKQKVMDKKIELSPEEATTRLKGYAKALGASLVGTTKINPLWIYSHRGEIFNDNWEDWGENINLNHTHAIVCAEEMKADMVGAAPHTPTCIESMMNYAKGAYITTQLAGYIANLGYSATANHFRHYDALMTPLAVDAGLGEVGRLGYLITKKYGPRVRLSLVTTDLPLVQATPVDIGVEDFCKICKKCAVCCPSNSIPHGDMTVTNELLRWKLNAQTCFEFWEKVGTDCNICMNVCPWSHADTFPHRFIKTLITRNRLSRRLFNRMDDIFYGRKPKPKTPVKWAQFDPWE
jgi:ferredoxin